MSFTFKLIENASNFDDTQLTFTNTAGGLGMTVNITREFQAPTVTLVGNPLPTANTYSGSKMVAKQVKSGATSTYQIKVYSLGGNDFYCNNGNFTYSLVSTQSNSTKTYRVGIKANTYNASGSFNFDIRNLKDTSKKVTHTIDYISSRPTMKDNTPANCIEYTPYDASGNFYVRNDVGGLYGRTDLSFSISSPGGLKTPTSFNSKFTISNTHAWTTSEPWDTFKLAIAGGINTNMNGGSAGNVSIGSYTFESKESTYFQNLTIAFYNRLPIGRGKWASKINGVYCALITTYIYYDSAVNEVNKMGNGWFMPGWKAAKNIFGLGDWSENVSVTRSYPDYFSNVFQAGRFYTTDYSGDKECGVLISNINTTNRTANFKWVLMTKGAAEDDNYAVAIHE